MKKSIVFLVFTFLAACSTIGTEGVEVVNTSAFKELLDQENVQLVDVRTVEEFKSGHIPYALNFDVKLDDFTDRISLLDTLKPVLVYCKSGGRSAKAATILKENGFKEVFDLKNGFTQWKEDGEKVED